MKYQTINTTDFLEQTKFWADIKKTFQLKEPEVRGKVMKALQYHQIFNHEDWVERSAWLVSNKEDAQPVSLDEKGLPQTHEDLSQLIASIVREDPVLKVSLLKSEYHADNHKLSQWLSAECEDKEKLVSEFASFDWTIDPGENVWADRQLVLGHIMDKTVERSNIFKLIDNSLLEDRAFILQMFECEKTAMIDALSFLPKEKFMSEPFFDVVKTNKYWFGNVWKKYYFDLSIATPQFDKTGLVSRILSEVFTNKEMIKYLLPDNLKLFWHLPQNLKEDKDIMTEMLRNNSKLNLSFNNRDFIKLLSADYFKNEDNVALFFAHADKYLIGQLENYPQIWQDWIDNKQKVLNFSVKTVHDLTRFFKQIPDRLKEDRDIALMMTENSKDGYAQVPDSLKGDKAIIINYLKKEPAYNLPLLSNDRVFALDSHKDRDLIIELLKKNSGYIKNEKTPSDWKKDEEFLSYVGLAYKSCFTEEEHKELLKKPDFFVRLMKNTPHHIVFSDLPSEARAHPEVSLTYIEKQKEQNKNNIDLMYIPARLWSNRQFALQAVTLTQDALKYVAKGFWNDKAFIVGLLGLVDSGKVSGYTLRDNAPAKLLQFFDNYGITSGYKPFITSYFLREKLDQNLPENDEPDTPRLKI